MLTGGCHCGAARYEANGQPYHETICHCTDCRRIVGAASVAWLTVRRATFRFRGREPSSVRSSARVTRRFCGACGTSLTYEHDALPDEIDVTIASLDDADAWPPKDHTRVREKLPWETICDSLPAFMGARTEDT